MFEKKPYKIKSTDTKTPCEVTIEVVVPKETIAKHRAEAITKLGEQVKIDGFRPGHVPEKVLVEKVGEMTINEEACRTAIDSVFPEILAESKHFPINQPQINVTKMAIGEDAELHISFSTSPVVELKNYKKLAAKHNSAEKPALEITEAEMDTAMMDLRKQVAHMDYHAKPDHSHDDHSHGDLEPAALDDEFAKKVGPFKTVDEVTKALKENLLENKKRTEVEKSRIKLIDEIIADSEITYPSFFLTSEQNLMIEELKTDLARMGVTLDAYLKQLEKTEDDIRAERKEIADKRVKSQLVLSKIANLESLKPNEVVVEEQMKEISKSHPGVDQAHVRSFVERFEINQLVWKWLEEQK